MHFYGDFLVYFIPAWFLTYAGLVTIYLSLGQAVCWLNCNHLQSMRIQSRPCSRKLQQRDFRQSLKSLLSISAMLAAGLACRDLGLGLPAVELTWVSGMGWAIASLLLFDTWFYWFHRLIHHPKLFRKIHRWHHRSRTPTVWANNSDALLDNLFCQSYWFFAPILLPAPTALLVAHKIYDQITGMLGHAGYEYAPGRLSAKPSPMIGTSFHDLHHSTFVYNYATHFSIWDRLMGTIHPDYDQLVTSFPKTDAK